MGGGGLFGGGGGGGGNSAGATTTRMNRYVADTQADNARLLSAISGIASGMESSVKSRSDEYLAGMSSEEKTALSRLERANNWLTDTNNAMSDTFAKDARRALDDLTAASTLLNKDEKAAVSDQISSYRAEADKLDSDLQRTIDSTISRYDSATRDATQEFDTRASGLGDTFVQSARRALQDYGSTMDEATSLNPQRLNIFTQAADYISRAAQQTRMSLIEAADPNYRQMRDQVDAITSANLDGRIDSQTAGNLSRTAAFRALNGGFLGSQMQRNLEARDLGLTTLDLQNRGLSTFASERNRRFQTEVDGLQADPNALLRDNQSMMQNAANTRLTSELQTAESDRNQRQGALDTVFGANLARVDTRRGDELTLGYNMANSAAARSRDVLGLNLGNTANFYGNQRNLAATQFNTNMGLSQRLFDVGLATSNSLYGTNVNAATDFYRTNANTFGNIYQTRSNAAAQAATMNANAQNAAAANLASVRAGANSQIERAYQQDAMIAQQQAADRNAMWGSIVNTGATLIGAAVGTAAGNPMAGAQIGSMAGSAITGSGGGGGGGGGGFSALGSLGSLLGSGSRFNGYTGFTNNPATGKSIGYAAPTSYKLPGTSNWVT